MIAAMTSPSATNHPTMPLSMVSRGETVIVRHIHGQPKLRQRLFDLGLNQGAEIRIVKNELPHPLIIAVKEDSRLALERGMTQHILVTPTNGIPGGY